MEIHYILASYYVVNSVEDANFALFRIRYCILVVECSSEQLLLKELIDKLTKLRGEKEN